MVYYKCEGPASRVRVWQERDDCHKLDQNEGEKWFTAGV